MGSPSNLSIEITPQVLLKAYACGIFPMAESAEDTTLYWIEPERRGILALEGLHVPRRLARVIKQGKFEVRVDSDYHGVIEGCASSRAGRRTTWINRRIRELYADLFDMGYCHTVETWRDGKLVGGLYGVALGRSFFGESMFSYETDASKVALVYLAARLRYGDFCLLDTQFVTEHLRQFGAQEISRAAFHRRLEQALQGFGAFDRLPADMSAEGVLQLVSHTSKVGCSTA
ncbi:leucyl/phenylalanyl-tRNA/protein transferase [Rhodomicrobium vannielii ATCC 17100]|jgi:leucyl/phenylalanyl-tRNA---protein transferase|uniref:Leucyl/phenylalanyl-tRNA--protein transferase n=1 Tax=Rhodomicrobium vannielii (strain ATCC 17100 / DSM 162 / LMG 4299 / NCIMB 10020 / ATH 3.1.1) TaxID=648757 RepID=E3I3F2_RHOVT|nr:leucyl/phenylalanyl-tRNA--protein transferase [Rhodomicrobium vannielii]ADP72600.1 leucyl/phenylalanyl-tRNA/protein transferase [Rhodomicrobium vannielii ATCC 17100]